jgi:endonuclease/exonuclease/phosphatase family metal-dependent hydrolase
MSQLTSKYNHCIVCGDFNMNIQNNTRRIRQMVDKFADINLVHVPIWDTHHTATSNSTIDLYFVPSNVLIENTGKLPVPDLSMHDLLYLSYPIEVENKVLPARKYAILAGLMPMF